MSATGALPGFRDFYPERLAERAWLFERWRDVARRFGYVEYDGPPLEPLELYTRKSGDEIVGQLYNFSDKGGRDVALRPEMTPTVARMVGARANALRKPIRWFSIPQLFRYERQQKGRLREHFQLNVDIFGESDVAADAELLAVACEIMRACGLGPDDVRARVSDRRLLSAVLTAMGVAAEHLSACFAWIDKIDRISVAEFSTRLSEAGLGKLLSQQVHAVATMSSTDSLRRNFGGDVVVAPILDGMDRYFSLLELNGVREFVDLDLRIVRGLDYYTGIVFELFDNASNHRAICGGGRYDDLLEALGYDPMPALGFGMGDVVLSDLLREKGRLRRRDAGVYCWVAAFDADETAHARVIKIAAQLRRAGWAVGHALKPQSLSRQMKAASAAGVSKCVILPPLATSDFEFAQPVLRIRDFTSGTEIAVPESELLRDNAAILDPSGWPAQPEA